ncbi:hypothetical protein IMSHALPRED_008437 [Imshaugia aleurites]|uniref:Cation efflux protein transmembrane domain-containing protein n=1 Tax=Imshaugia aleurites TaxID=172621 RepID=A0A8H3I023_9LECA|nr:hypothetical protein IMSHALPRED_008437 [Imshaugia aleurites]
MVHKPLTNGHAAKDYKPDDLEAAISASRRKPRFKDIVNAAVHDGFHSELKRKLKDGVDRDELEKYRKSVSELKEMKDKKVRGYYEQQNERLNDWLEVDTLVMSMADDVLDSMNPQDADGDGVAEIGGVLKTTKGDIDPLLPEDERERRKTGERRAKWAININVIANIILLIAKIVAAFASSSLSLIASLVDSALDLLCTLIIWTTNKLVQWKIKRLQHKFPVGRRRLEPLGILVFSIIMIVSFLQILQESVTKLLPGGPRDAATLPPVAIGALVATVVIKGIIWFGCIRVKTTQVQALAQGTPCPVLPNPNPPLTNASDCKTDVVFNTLSLLFPLIGHQLSLWWLDPVGAALLSLFIIYDWAETCFENVARLTGSAVSATVLQKVTFLAWRFAPVVDAYKTITAYHAGDGVWVEMDIMLSGETRLSRTHDIAETLQYCLEGLSEVDRAFVSVDYTSQGPTGHAVG